MADHRAQEAKGRVKEAAGSLAGKDDLERKGQDDRAKASVKRKAGQAKNKVQDTASRAKDKASGAARRATGRK
jgi:uncharacterized protein YjbJ (UPF0337 family)